MDEYEFGLERYLSSAQRNLEPARAFRRSLKSCRHRNNYVSIYCRWAKGLGLIYGLDRKLTLAAAA